MYGDARGGEGGGGRRGREGGRGSMKHENKREKERFISSGAALTQNPLHELAEEQEDAKQFAEQFYAADCVASRWFLVLSRIRSNMVRCRASSEEEACQLSLLACRLSPKLPLMTRSLARVTSRQIRCLACQECLLTLMQEELKKLSFDMDACR